MTGNQFGLLNPLASQSDNNIGVVLPLRDTYRVVPTVLTYNGIVVCLRKAAPFMQAVTAAQRLEGSCYMSICAVAIVPLTMVMDRVCTITHDYPFTMYQARQGLFICYSAPPRLCPHIAAYKPTVPRCQLSTSSASPNRHPVPRTVTQLPSIYSRLGMV